MRVSRLITKNGFVKHHPPKDTNWLAYIKETSKFLMDARHRKFQQLSSVKKGEQCFFYTEKTKKKLFLSEISFIQKLKS